MVVVLEEPVVVKYSSYGSIVTTFVWLLGWILTIVIPFIFVFFTPNFYRGADFFTEKPSVFFPMKALLFVKSQQPESTRIWTTNTNVNNLIGDSLVFPSFTTDFTNSQDPENYQQLPPDTLKFQFQVPQSTFQPTTGISTLIFLQMHLSQYQSLSFETVAYISSSSAVPCQSLTVLGRLEIKQDGPLLPAYSATTFNTTALDLATVDSLDKLNVDNILSSYNRRPVTGTFVTTNVIWSEGYKDTFTVNIEIFIPKQLILYQPYFWELLKFSWIQYVCALSIMWVIVKIVHRIIIVNGLLSTRMSISLKKFM